MRDRYVGVAFAIVAVVVLVAAPVAAQATAGALDRAAHGR